MMGAYANLCHWLDGYPTKVISWHVRPSNEFKTSQSRDHEKCKSVASVLRLQVHKIRNYFLL